MILNVFTRRLSVLSLAAAFALVGIAQAGDSLLWYDGFSLTDEGGDYDTTNPLGLYHIPADPGDPMADPPVPPTPEQNFAGQAGGTGTFFSGAWVPANQTDPASWVYAQTPGLSRPGLTEPVVGGAAGRGVQFDCCVFTRTSRLFDSPWGGFSDPDGTFYMGFLIDFGTGNPVDPHHRTVEMHFDGFDDNANRNLMFGISNFAGLGNELALNVRDSVTDMATNVVLAEQADVVDLAFQGTHYVVLKFEMSTAGDDVISAFLDPVGSVEPAPSASVTVGQFLADRLSSNAQFTFNSADPASAGHFDELRVSTDWAGVGINTLQYVPEPASLCLVGIGAMGLLLGGRRK